MFITFKRILTAIGCALLFAPGASAQMVGSETIIQALKPENTGPLVRSWGAQQKRGITITGQLPKEVDLPKIPLTINFDLDSANLTYDGMRALEALANALQHKELAGTRFQIAGHTDGRGDFAYNMDLGQRRAQRVVDYLFNHRQISRDRIVPVSYGFTRPMNGVDVKDPINRRVEVINLGPLS